MGKHSKPNLRIPLVPSINSEQFSSFAFAVDDFDGQLMCNMVHNSVRNEASGDGKRYLCRRPGWNAGQTAYGTATKVPHLMFRRPSDGADSWMAAYDTGGAQVITDGTTNTTVFTDTNYLPAFVTVANLAGTAKAVVQFRKDFSTAQRVFYGSSIASWTEITDAVFTALVHRGKIEFLDSHLFALASDRNIYNCKVNDPATWPAGNLIPKSIKLDIPSGLILHKNVLLAMGNESAEGFVTDGSNNPSGSVLSRRKDLIADIGLAEVSGNGSYGTGNGLSSYYATVGGMTFFLGQERRVINLYAFDGSSFTRVPTNDYLSQVLSGFLCYGVHPFFFNGHRAVALHMTPPAGSGDNVQRWWVFDVDWKQWYLFTSNEFMPINDGQQFAGASNGRDELFYPAGFSTFSDGLGGTHVFDAYVQFEIPNDTNEQMRMAWYGVKGKTAQAASTVEIQFADDDDFSALVSRGSIDMTAKNKRLYRGGTFQRRAVKILHADDVECKLEEFQARIEQ